MDLSSFLSWRLATREVCYYLEVFLLKVIHIKIPWLRDLGLFRRTHAPTCLGRQLCRALIPEMVATLHLELLNPLLGRVLVSNSINGSQVTCREHHDGIYFSRHGFEVMRKLQVDHALLKSTAAFCSYYFDDRRASKLRLQRS